MVILSQIKTFILSFYIYSFIRIIIVFLIGHIKRVVDFKIDSRILKLLWDKNTLGANSIMFVCQLASEAIILHLCIASISACFLYIESVP